MKSVHEDRRRQRGLVVGTLIMFQLVIVLLQLWLFVSVLDGVAAGASPIGFTATVVSLACFAANAWMLVGVWRIDRAE